MKKAMIWFLAVLLVLSLAACGNSTELAENNDTETTKTQPAADGGESSGQEENASVNDDSEKETGASQDTASQDNREASAVYFTSDISPEGLMAVYEALNWEPAGSVAVKLSTGEPPESNYLEPELIKDLVQSVDGTIVECNTAYGGSRTETAMHRQVAEDHGFTAT